MKKLITDIHTLLGTYNKKIFFPILFSILDSLLNSCMYGVLLFFLLDLVNEELTLTNWKFYFFSLLAIFLLRCLVQAIGFTLVQCLGPNVTKMLRLQLGNHLRQLPLGYFHNNSIGELSSVVLGDVGEFETIVTHCICDCIKTISFGILSLLLSFVISPLYGILLVGISLLCLPLLFSSGNASATGKVNLQKAKAHAISRIIEYIEGMKTFRLYRLTGERQKQLSQSLQDIRKYSIRAELSVLPKTLNFTALSSMMIPLSMALGAYLLVNNSISIAQFLLMQFMSISMSSILTGLSTLYPQIRALQKASDHIISVLNEPAMPYKIDTITSNRSDIVFDHVSFDYKADSPILKNVSFSLPSGTMTALVGPSGSGKTTLASLLARFYDVKKGSILLNGKDLRMYSPDALAEQTAVVFQDVYLFQNTIWENICVGKPNATKEEILAASKAAHCHEFITKLEKGYETLAGEGGCALSGGEKQRISIARALLKDAPIVILDESTSNLDADNEYEIQMALKELMKNKTVLVIAHRLKTVTDAEQILVLKDGQIIEKGNHHDLLQNNGWYANLCYNQEKATTWKV